MNVNSAVQQQQMRGLHQLAITESARGITSMKTPTYQHGRQPDADSVRLRRTVRPG
jgi:hypothetical protein